MAARARLQSERKALRQDRSWIRNPQNPLGFEAKPQTLADGTQNLMKWDCAIPGEKGTIWEGGLLPLTLTFTEDYATAPPAAQFKQAPNGKPIFHPNIFPDGKVCLSLLKPKPHGGWTPAHTIKMVLVAIQRLLKEPNNDDAAQADAHNIYAKPNKAEYNQKVKAQMLLPGLRDPAYSQDVS